MSENKQTISAGDTPPLLAHCPVLDASVSSGEIGIVIRRFESPFYGQLVDVMDAELKKYQLSTNVRSAQGTASGELDAINSLMRSGCEGLVICSATLDDDILRTLCGEFPATVIIGRYIDALTEHCIYSDNWEGGVLAASCLINNGHKQIAMVTGPRDRKYVRQREEGFVFELNRRGLEIPPQLIIESDFYESGGAVAMTRLLDGGEPFCAVFFHNDLMAMGALQVCSSQGILVPDNISIIGYDDILACRYCVPPLTTIHTLTEQMGLNAVNAVHRLIRPDDRIQSKDPHAGNLCPQIVERHSVSAPNSQRLVADSNTPQLSTREINCLEWTAKGKTSWEISIILGISESTVVYHIRNSIAKLHAANRTQAVAIAVKKSLIGI